MKKILSLLLVAVMVFGVIGLVGCKNDPGETSTTTTTKAPVTTTTTTTAPVTTTTTTQGTTTTTEMVTTTLPMFARFDFGTDTVAQDNKETSHEWLVNALSYNKDLITVEFLEDSWKITANKDYATDDASDGYSICFDKIVELDYEDLVPGWGTWARYPVNESYVGNPASWEGKHQFMKIRIKNNTVNNMISFGYKGNNGSFGTTFCV